MGELWVGSRRRGGPHKKGGGDMEVGDGMCLLTAQRQTKGTMSGGPLDRRWRRGGEWAGGACWVGGWGGRGWGSSGEGGAGPQGCWWWHLLLEVTFLCWPVTINTCTTQHLAFAYIPPATAAELLLLPPRSPPHLRSNAGRLMHTAVTLSIEQDPVNSFPALLW